MTGYSRTEGTTSLGEVKVEVRSLNHRFLDLNLRLPRELSPLEMKVRELVRKRISRGKVDLTVRLDRTSSKSPPLTIEVDWGLLQAYIRLLRDVKDRFGLEGEVSLEHILIPRELISFRELEVEEGVWQELEPLLVDALQRLLQSRLQEGKALLEDMTKRLSRLRELVARVQARAPLVVEEYRKRLRDRLRTLLQGQGLDEGRFEQEVTYFAERSDITEEVVRLKTHVEAFEKRLQGHGPAGRALEFLLQEIYREANTVGAKAHDLEIVQATLAIKEEVEKLREQVQNVE